MILYYIAYTFIVVVIYIYIPRTYLVDTKLETTII